MTKTAADLPEGAEVYWRGVTYTKGALDDDHPWVSSEGEHLRDGSMDRLLAEGATITRVPVGRRALRDATRDSDRG